ncbi:MAG: SNF2-related protein, partial [Gammaproteobacteria bacterium]
MSATPTLAPNDPFLLDTERLQALFPEPVLRAGLADFRQQCVADLDRGDDELLAEVEDTHSEALFRTHIWFNAGGELITECACGTSPDTPCRHAAAALYAYASSEGDELLGAADGAIEERIQRGRTEVMVTPLDGTEGLGVWKAKSITSSSHYSRSYRVNVRSLQRVGNHCTCPDFATNQLGTCKHIEAVLHRLGKLSKAKRAALRVTRPYVYLNWDVDDAPRIALHRGAGVAEDLVPELDEVFDAQGLFTGRLPDDYYRLAERVEGRDDIDLGEDAAAHVRRLSAQAAHQVRARDIRERIAAGGGHIPGIKARLYPYQVAGAAFLAANGRALLADDMGLGKTLQSIAAARWLHDHAGARRILVACPASLKQQWAREIERFTGMAARVIQGGPEARGVQYRRGDGFFIVNYELILRDLTVINETLSPDLLILDEAQRIKNWRTKIAAAVKLIPSRYAFVLSGTPLENRLEDLYSLMQVVDPQVLGPLWRYLVDFHVSDERGKVLGYRNLSELRRRLAPVMLRRDRSLVRDQLPERIQQRLDVSMTPAQQDLHDAA